MAKAFSSFLSSTHVRILCRETGADLTEHLSSFTYNAAISAYELRAPRRETGSALPDLPSQGALVVTVKGAVECLVHYETLTRVPVEIAIGRGVVIRSEQGDEVLGHGTLVEELLILRGARIELVG